MNHYVNYDYALNKKSTGIVYGFVDGAKEITLQDFLNEYPGATPDDFDALKAWSDNDYLERDRNGYNTTRKNVNLDWADQAGECGLASPEDSLVAAIDAREESEQRMRIVKLANQALDKLTDIQRRRYLLYVVDGLTVRKIAELEGVAFQVVDRSILSAKMKIQKFLEKCQSIG